MEKIRLWKRRLQAGNISFFPYLYELLDENKDLDQHYLDQKNKVMSYLDCLAEEFVHYFRNAALYNPILKLVLNPFNNEVNRCQTLCKNRSSNSSVTQVQRIICKPWIWWKRFG
jgi:hypothetical protein